MALELKELIEHIARLLVDDPSQVQVVEVESEDVTTYEVRVAPEDVGRVIGKGGQTVEAMSRILRSASARAQDGKQVCLEIVKPRREGLNNGA